MPDDAADAAPERPPWGLAHAVVGYIVSFFLAGVAFAVYASVAGLKEGDESLGTAIAVFIGLWAGMLGTLVIATRQAGGTFRSEFGLMFRPIDIAIGAVAGIGAQLFLLRLVYIPWRMFDDGLAERLEDPAKDLTGLADGPGYIILSLLITIGAPLVEELFFRGLLQRSLLRRMAPAWAIGITAFAFAVAHSSVVTIPGLTAFGVVAGVLAHRSGRLGPAIATHFFFNLVTVIALGAA